MKARVDLRAQKTVARKAVAVGEGGQQIDLGITSAQRKPPVCPRRDMIRQLIEGQEALARTARNVFATTEKASDRVTSDLLTQRMQVHEKTAWMLRSLLE